MSVKFQDDLPWLPWH